MPIFLSKKSKRQLRGSLHKNLKLDYLIISILVVLFGLLVFSIINLVLVFRLRQEWQGVQAELTSSASVPEIRYYSELNDNIIVPDAINVQMATSTGEIKADVIASPTADKPVSPIKPAEIELIAAPPAEIKPLIKIPEVPIIPINNINRSQWKYNVFGDGFSNSYYVDMAKTNLFYDEMATSFSFKPLYEKRDNGSCSEEYCGFSEKAKMDDNGNYSIGQKYCLTKNSQLCVSWDGAELKYNGKEVKEFSAYFSGLSAERVSIYPLSNYWLVGAVWTENGREVGRAWRYDGRTLSALDPENRVPFVTRERYSGSSIYFGGDDSNYIVLYAGYDFIGYQIVNNTLWNISDFFNIRLVSGGFAPQIIKHQQGVETVWYICSLTTNKPKLIKLWQNGSRVIRGSLSLGEEIFSDGYSAALCREGADGYLEIAVAKGSGEAVTYNKWSLIDKGFDQSHDYQAVSVNLASARGNMEMANFNGLGLCGVNDCGSSVLTSNNLSFTISNNASDWQVPALGQEYLFTTDGDKLFWKLQASADPGRSYYSPWFSAVNSVYYAWVE